MSGDASAPAGWYDDPDSPGIVRYWDGTEWTERRAPRPAPTGNRTPGDVAEGVFVGVLMLVLFAALIFALWYYYG
jgi:hypothetical protein